MRCEFCKRVYAEEEGTSGSYTFNHVIYDYVFCSETCEQAFIRNFKGMVIETLMEHNSMLERMKYDVECVKDSLVYLREEVNKRKKKKGREVDEL